MGKRLLILLPGRRLRPQLRPACTTGRQGKSSRTVAYITVLLVVGLILSMVACDNTGQLTGMYSLAFTSTAVCNGQQKTIQFKNTGDEAITISGVGISYGTNPKGDFSLTSAIVGTTETQSDSSGSVNDLTVPPGTNYSFNITYTPRTPNTTNSALLDIAYTAPKSGIVQVALLGSATGQAPNCSTSPVPQGGAGGSKGSGTVTLDGNATITINRIALLTNAVPQPITTDAKDIVGIYTPPTLPIIFDLTGQKVTLPLIPKGQFILPPPKRGGPLGNVVSGKTDVTTTADTTGKYQSDGSITISGITVHLSENFSDIQSFEADLPIPSLTTGAVNVPSAIKEGVLRSAGFNLSSDGKQAFGVPINSSTFDVTLVGTGTFINGTGKGTLANTINDSRTGIVTIQATIKPPTK